VTLVIAYAGWSIYQTSRPTTVSELMSDSGASYCGKEVHIEGRARYTGEGSTYELLESENVRIGVDFRILKSAPKFNEAIRVSGIVTCANFGLVGIRPSEIAEIKRLPISK
jgi:hypothetical protein